MNARRATGRALALVLAALGLGVLSGPAQASGAAPAAWRAPSVTTTMPTAAVDPAAVGSLTIHKYLVAGNVPAENVGTGTESPVPPGSRPLAGVTFAVSRVEGVDLTTPEGWDLVAQYQGDGMGQARQKLGPSILTAPTDARGVAIVAGLPVGLYHVHEQSILTGAGVDDPSVIPSPDFLVTVPVADPIRSDRWIYDLHLYPKDSRVQIVKELLDGNVGIADQDAPVAGRVLTYIDTATIPSDGLRVFGGRCERAATVDGGATARGSATVIDSGPGLDEFGFTSTGMCAPGANYVGTSVGAAYEIIDDLTMSAVPGGDQETDASDYLAYATDDWVGEVVVELTGQTAPLRPCGDPATECDYVLTRVPTSVTISMTDAGLLKLAAAKDEAPDATVRMTVHAKVLPTVTTEAAARMLLEPDQPSAERRSATAPPVSARTLVIPGIAVLVPTGAAKANDRVVLSNIVQTIYSNLVLHKMDRADSRNLPGAVFSLYRTLADADARTRPLATVTTGADGLATFNGVHVTDFQNNTSDSDSYWLVETEAPAGYIGLTAPLQVRVLSDGTTVGADDSGGLPVTNQKLLSPGGILAFTGMNIGWLLGLGLGLVGLGALFALAARRRHDDVAGDPR